MSGGVRRQPRADNFKLRKPQSYGDTLKNHHHPQQKEKPHTETRAEQFTNHHHSKPH